MRSKELLEGIHDPHRHKAIFMLGGPGSGKTHVARQLVGGSGLKMVNVDDVYEHLRNRSNITGAGFDTELYSYSGKLTQKRMDNYIAGGLGMIIDGTGRKIDRLRNTKKELEELGYDTIAIFVNTDVLTALDRNDERRRKVNPQWLRDVHADLNRKMGELQRIFDNQLLVIDNTLPDQDLGYYQKKISQFINTPAHVTESIEDEQDIADHYKELSKQIIEECQPFLREVGMPLVPLYRGRKLRASMNLTDSFITPYREDRRPMSSSPLLHGILNYVIGLAGGVANRSNAIFTTGNNHTAGTYGETYVVFPRGSFHYTYSSEIEDWFVSLHNLVVEFILDNPDLIKPSGWAKMPDATQKRLQQIGQTDNRFVQSSIRRAVRFYLTMDDIDLTQASANDMLALEGTIKHDAGLRQAIDSGVEIMVSAKGGYIHVPAAYYDKYVQHYLELYLSK